MIFRLKHRPNLGQLDYLNPKATPRFYAIGSDSQKRSEPKSLRSCRLEYSQGKSSTIAGLLSPSEPTCLRQLPPCCLSCFCLIWATSDVMFNTRFTADSHGFRAQTIRLRLLNITSSCHLIQQVCNRGASDLKQQKWRYTSLIFRLRQIKDLYTQIESSNHTEGGRDAGR